MTRSQERRKLNERYLLLKEWYGKEYAKTEMAAHTCQPKFCLYSIIPNIAAFF